MATALKGFINLALLPMSRRQSQKTKAYIAIDLMRQGAREVVTPKGVLKFHALRGSGVASAVETFHTDEPETREWIDTYIKPGEILWDIGASIGLYSLYAALNENIKVFSFEPSALNFSLLVEHVALNRMGNRVTPLCIALAGDTRLDVLHMSLYDTGTAGNALGVPKTVCKTFEPVFSQGVLAFAGDDLREVFKLPQPQHIKLDVDSIEADILRGLQRTLPYVHSVIIEVIGSNAEDSARIEQSFAAAGLEEDISVRTKGSQRSRLYLNRKMLSGKK